MNSQFHLIVVTDELEKKEEEKERERKKGT